MIDLWVALDICFILGYIETNNRADVLFSFVLYVFLLPILFSSQISVMMFEQKRWAKQYLGFCGV